MALGVLYNLQPPSINGLHDFVSLGSTVCLESTDNSTGNITEADIVAEFVFVAVTKDSVQVQSKVAAEEIGWIFAATDDATESLAATEENESIAIDKGSTDSEANIDDQDDSVETDYSTVHVAAAGDLGNSVAAAAGFVDSVTNSSLVVLNSTLLVTRSETPRRFSHNSTPQSLFFK